MVKGTIWEFTFQVYEVDQNDRTIAYIAAANNVRVAEAAFQVAKRETTRTILQLCNRARIIKTERSERGWDDEDRGDRGPSGKGRTQG